MDKLSRLRAMSASEIGFRLREQIMIEAERAQVRVLGPRNPLAKHLIKPILDRSPWPGASCLAYLKQAFADRFYFSAADRDEVRRLVREKFPEWIEKSTKEADAICLHKVELLGYGQVSLGPQIDWNQDPVTHVIWPQEFWADYDPVHDTSCGDSKIIHELNRHQHLARLGKAFFLTGDERFATETIYQIESWIAQNPEGIGINWQSSLEISIRVISWLWAVFFILPSSGFTEDIARRVTRSMFAQLRHVYRYPSVYSSPNTHLIGEATALFIAGSLFDGVDGAAKWRDFGAHVLTREIERQVLDDGVYGELSTYYHCYAVDFYLQALSLARRNRFEFPASASTKVERMLEFVMHITRPDGSIPLLGDDDGGRALALDRTDYRSYRDGLSLGALLFSRPDFKRQAGALHEETFWLLGPEAWRAHEALATTVPATGSRSFPSAGYFVQRSGWEKDNSHLVFDCGGLGLPTGGHGHADALSLTLFAGGHDLLVDPGTSVYNAAPQWRGFFRSTRAHNTVVVDGRDQSEQAGTFQWRTRAEARVCAHFDLGGLEYLEGVHNGYERLPNPVSHKRRLLFCKPEYWIVLDEFSGAGSHTFDFNYHFSPRLTLDLRDVHGIQESRDGAPDYPVEILARGEESGLLLFLDATSPLSAKLINGQTAPEQGWVSTRYGSKEPAGVLCATAECSPPLVAATILVPLRNNGDNFATPAIRRESVSGSALSCSITSGGRTDLLMVPATAAMIEIVGLKLQGELFWLHLSNGAPRRLLGIGVRSAAQGENILFGGPERTSRLSASFFEDCIVIETDTAKETIYVRDLRNS